MCHLGWAGEGGVLLWRRRLRAWEGKMKGECRTLLNDFVMQTYVLDQWQWQPDPVRGYSVCGVYQILMYMESVHLDEVTYFN
jgi:hypothetical protein